MAESSVVSGGDDVLASQYNNLRKDVLSTVLRSGVKDFFIR